MYKYSLETCRTRKLTQLIDLYFYCFIMYTVHVFQRKYFIEVFDFLFVTISKFISFVQQIQGIMPGICRTLNQIYCRSTLFCFNCISVRVIIGNELNRSSSLFLFLLLFASFLPPKYLLPESCFSELLNAMQDRFLLFCKHTHMLFYRRRPIQ